jgi:hypothetical protein
VGARSDFTFSDTALKIDSLLVCYNVAASTGC